MWFKKKGGIENSSEEKTLVIKIDPSDDCFKRADNLYQFMGFANDGLNIKGKLAEGI